jgi:hypothetical protein
MDIKRSPKSKLKKRIRTTVLIVIGVAAIGGITYGLSKMKPAAPHAGSLDKHHRHRKTWRDGARG